VASGNAHPDDLLYEGEIVDVSFNYLALSIIRKYVQNVLKPLKKMKIS